MDLLSEIQPGIYYQDILADGSRSVLRQNFPVLQRMYYDKRPPVIQTLKITVEVYETKTEEKEIDTSDIPETDEKWFQQAKLVLPEGTHELTLEEAEKLFSGGKP